MRCSARFLLAAAVVSFCIIALCSADSKRAAAKASLFENFGPGWTARWHYATAKKYEGRFQVVKPPGFQDTAIKMPEANKHYGMTALLDEPLDPKDGLVVQYEVKFSEGHKCGGAYLKLLSAPADGSKIVPEKLTATTPFSIMFGPDRCGPDARVHVILRMHNPANGNTTEHHLMSAPTPQEDLLSHVYALLLHSNGRYKVLVDGLEEASGDLMSADFSPPLQPLEIIPDPDDQKPEDWVEEEMMDDPAAVKPEGWDDRRIVSDPSVTKPEGWLDHEVPDIPDPNAIKPDDWDEAKEGVWLPPPILNPKCENAPGCGPWKAPLISNPKYSGPWIPPQVKNPDYKGDWKQREISNPGYFKLEDPLELVAPIAAVAFELWTTDVGYTFDSVLLGSGEAGIAAAAAYMRDTWRPRNLAEKAAYMAAERAKARPAGLRNLAANTILDLLDAKLLSGVRPHLGPMLWLLEEHPELGWVLLVAPAMMIIALFLERRKQAGIVEEPEEPEPEIEVDDEENKRLSKQAAALQKQRTASAGGADERNSKQQQKQQGGDGVAAGKPKQQQQQQGLGDGGGEGGGSEPSSEEAGEEPAASQVRRRAQSRRA